MIVGATPIFATDDIVKTVEFYKEILGCDSSWTLGDPPSFGSVSWGGTAIMFNLQPELAAKVEGHQHWIKTERIDELYERHKANGAKIISEIADRPWGFREYVVEGPNGYHLRFSGNLSSVPEKSLSFPEGVQILRRMPTSEEHVAIAGAAFDQDGKWAGALEQTWRGIVALSPDGTAIGMVRIMYDSPGWYSIWDVAVLPEWQGRRIGEAMMKEALQVVRETSPGAFVFLFTIKPGFYEKLGFDEGTVTIRKV